jgi:hypothetical protein
MEPLHTEGGRRFTPESFIKDESLTASEAPPTAPETAPGPGTDASPTANDAGDKLQFFKDLANKQLT